MPRTVSKTRRTPAEAARDRLRAKPAPPPQVAAPPAAPARPGSDLSPDVAPRAGLAASLDIVVEKVESQGQAATALTRRVTELEGDLFRIADALAGHFGPGKLRDTLMNIVTKHQGNAVGTR